MDKKQKVIEIKGRIKIPKEETYELFLVKFMLYVEGNGWKFNGKTTPLIDSEDVDE